MTKVLNPLIVKFAGRRHFGMAAQIQHVGRRSGKVYLTPASAHVHGNVILIALTFGNQSDWVRNVRAADGCTVRINGRTYRATSPEFVSREEAAPLLKATFSPLQRAGMHMLGVHQFLRLHAMPAGPNRAGDLKIGSQNRTPLLPEWAKRARASQHDRTPGC